MGVVVALLAGAAGGLASWAAAYAVKTHLGAQRQQVAFILGLSAAAVILGGALLLAVIPIR
jgi:hypothetical protein